VSETTKELLAIDGVPAAAPEIGRALWMLEDARRRTLEFLAGADPAIIDRTPAPGENSIGALLYHIPAIEADWLYAEVLEEPFPPELVALFPDDVRDDQGRLSAHPGEDLAGHFHRLAVVRARLLEVFSTMTSDEFRRRRDLPEYAVTPEWVVHHLLQHEAQHRGEIGMLRMLVERSGALGAVAP
jgi:uncharacterized damage-inducible protein DinB